MLPDGRSPRAARIADKRLAPAEHARRAQVPVAQLPGSEHPTKLPAGALADFVLEAHALIPRQGEDGLLVKRQKASERIGTRVRESGDLPLDLAEFGTGPSL